VYTSRNSSYRDQIEGKLLELAESIKHHGLIQPVTES
jgi:ParB-like chromosome segregation protein Spo0J